MLQITLYIVRKFSQMSSDEALSMFEEAVLFKLDHS